MAAHDGVRIRQVLLYIQLLTGISAYLRKIGSQRLVGCEVVQKEDSAWSRVTDGTSEFTGPAYIVIVVERVASIACVITYEHNLERGGLSSLELKRAALR